MTEYQNLKKHWVQEDREDLQLREKVTLVYYPLSMQIENVLTYSAVLYLV